MNQMFFGNARVMLFTPNGGSSSPQPTTRAKTRLYFNDSTYQDILVEGSYPSNEICQIDPMVGGQIKKIELGSAVTSIDSLENTVMIEELIIPTTVSAISASAFINAYQLTKVTIPDNIINVGTQAFFTNQNITFTIIANGGNAKTLINTIKNSGTNPMTNFIYILPNGLQYSEHGATWYKYYDDTEWRTVEIDSEINSESSMPPEATSQIPDMYNVTDLHIGTNVSKINTFAFFDCIYLRNVTIPYSVNSLGEGIFQNCTSLENVVFQDRTLEEVQTIYDVYQQTEFYPWGIENTNVISVI